METDYKELYVLIRKYGIDIDDNPPNYGLEKDLGFYGDEAEDFLIEFSEKFNVNLDDFYFDKHFSPEGGIFRINSYPGKKKIHELRINDLKKAIRTGKLE